MFHEKRISPGIKRKENKRGSQEATDSWLSGALCLVQMSGQLQSPVPAAQSMAVQSGGRNESKSGTCAVGKCAVGHFVQDLDPPVSVTA